MSPAKYIEELQEAIRAIHGCESRHVATSHVTEVFEGELAWTGEVETFESTGHPGYEDGGMLRSTCRPRNPASGFPWHCRNHRHCRQGQTAEPKEMNPPTVKNVANDLKNNVTIHFMAYRRMTKEELDQQIALLYGKQKRQPKNKTFTVITTIGAEG
jgi:hypothetical protein